MTYEEFLACLSKTPRKWQKVGPLGGNVLRLELIDSQQNKTLVFCPLTAVYYQLTGTYCRVDEWARVANKLEVDFGARSLAEASDGLGLYNITIRTMRDDLCQACSCQGTP